MRIAKNVFLAFILSLSAYGYDNYSDYQSCNQGPVVILGKNVNKSIPEIPKSSKEKLSSFFKSQEEMMQERYSSIKRKIVRNGYIDFVRDAAKAFDLDPILVLGAVVGEHVFNVDMKDSAQDYLLKLPGWMTSWVRTQEKFEISLSEILKDRNFDSCHEENNDFDKWNCFGSVWQKKYRNKPCPRCKDRSKYPDNSLKYAFFSPFGSTYGVGQLGPMKALMVADLVSKNAPNIPEISLNNIEGVYDAVLNPEYSFYFVAATLYKAIEIYKEYACYDISENPGVVGTLYNLGKEKYKAKKKQRQNIKSLRAGDGLVIPEENYYGWFINNNIDDLRSFLEKN